MAFTPDLSTSGGTIQGLGYPGGVADGTPAIIDTKINESATAIDFGIPVVRGVATAKQPGNCKPMAADTDDIIGISVRNASQVAANPADNIVNYPRYENVPVGRIGRFYVIAAEASREGDQVLILTAGAAVNSTCFGGSLGGVAGSGRVAFKGAKWRTTTAAAAIGIIELIDQNLGRTTT